MERICPTSLKLVLLNWAAPCSISQEMQSLQVSLMTWGLSDNMDSAGVLINPCFAYTKGKLHLEEKKVLEQLGSQNINMDCSFSIIFCEPADTRDERPLVYGARLLTPSPVEFQRHPFFKSDVRRHRRTSEIKQLESKKMKMVEDEHVLTSSAQVQPTFHTMETITD